MVFIDLETTGASLRTGGEISEAGLVKIDPVTLETIDERDLKFHVTNPLKLSDDELSYHRYNRFRMADWTDARPVTEMLAELQAFMTGCVPWGWGVSFERLWLDEYLDLYGLEWLGDYHWHCLMSVASQFLRPDFQAGQISTLSFSSVCSYLGLGSEPSPHQGLFGARYEVELYRILNRRLAITRQIQQIH